MKYVYIFGYELDGNRINMAFATSINKEFKTVIGKVIKKVVLNLEGYSDVKDISNALKKNELLKFLSGSELEELRIDDVSFFIEKVYDNIEDDDDLVEADKKYDKFKNLVSYKNSCISPVSVSPMYRN